MSKTLIAAAVLVAGCSADLRRVHTPQLLSVSQKEAARARGAHRPQRVRGQVSERSTWQIHTTLEGRDAMVDESVETAAIALDPARKDQYILIDLKQICEIGQVTQTHSTPDGHPKRYRIDTAGEHNFPYTLSFVGEGAAGRSRAMFRKPVQCRFIRITLMETSDAAWNVADLKAN